MTHAADEPECLNIADWFLDARLREGCGDRVALRGDDGATTYAEVAARANRFGRLLVQAGVRPEERVLLALPDGPDWVAAFFGILKIGAVVVMVNPELRPEAIEYFYGYTDASVALVSEASAAAFREAAAGGTAPRLREILVIDEASTAASLAAQPSTLETLPTHRDDAAIWLFSGGTTGKPKAVVQAHRSFVNTTRLYGQGVLGLAPDDVTISVPKLFFGYATGSNLLFPFSVGASAVLFPERCTPDVLFAQIAHHRPTVLVNVPTMVNAMVSHAEAPQQDLSCLRLSTSAGEALPVELYARWKAAFGVELLDGLGTAEQWHIFLSNRPGDVKPGTLGKPVPGFDVRVRDEVGNDLPDGEIGLLWAGGRSRAISYWRHSERSEEAFRGHWYVSGDMVRRDVDGTFVYCGRDDDMLKVSGKWLAPSEVENCLMRHAAVREVAVVGVQRDGLVKPKAWVVLAQGVEPTAATAASLQDWVRSQLEPYKYPREVEFLTEFPRTHLGKIDRGALKRR